MYHANVWRQRILPVANIVILCLVTAGWFLSFPTNACAERAPGVPPRPGEKPEKAAPTISREERLERDKQLLTKMRQHDGRLGWFYRTVDGDLIAGEFRYTPKGALVVFQDGDGLVLKHGETPFGRVSTDGKFELLVPLEKGAETKTNIKKWSAKEKGKPVMPPKWTVIRNEGGSKSTKEWISKPPKGSEGFGVITADGGLLFMPPETKPFPNVLWVVRRDDGGLDFIHAGPAREGLYMQVTKSGTITWTDPADARPGPGKAAPRWPVWDADGDIPVLPRATERHPSSLFLEPDYPSMERILYCRDGSVSLLDGRPTP